MSLVAPRADDLVRLSCGPDKCRAAFVSAARGIGVRHDDVDDLYRSIRRRYRLGEFAFVLVRESEVIVLSAASRREADHYELES